MEKLSIGLLLRKIEILQSVIACHLGGRLVH